MIMDTFTREQARQVAEQSQGLATVIGVPFEHWAHQCHAISTKLLYSGAFGPGRIARGGSEGVGGQHSWIVLGSDAYDPDATVVDPTLWSYRDDITGIYVGQNRRGWWHRPHGAGSCLTAGLPRWHGGDPIELDPQAGAGLSDNAREFLDMLGMLDRRGWSEVAHLPVEDWPAAEILAAICGTPALGAALIPIDIQGMLLGRVPGYRWPETFPGCSPAAAGRDARYYDCP
jgi:hypothetical protein